ncbi:MAG: ABC transporter ATP-binding protein [Dehalococcoidia bacterium]|nr:MAG: ABC transporter ATP-binding protein [Dehalococcoidia bacterium]
MKASALPPINKISLRRYRPLRKYALLYWDIKIAMLACSLLTGFGGMLGPYITKLTFDYAYTNRDWQLLVALTVFGFFMMLFNQVGSNVQQYLQLYASQNLTFIMRADFLRHLYSLPLSFFSARSTGEHVYRLNSDVPGTSNFLGGIVSTLISPFISVIYPLIGIIWLDWRFALVAVVATPLFVAHSRYFGHRQRKLAHLSAAENQRVDSEVVDRLAQIKLVKAFGREKREVRAYLSNQIKLIRLAYRSFWLNLWSGVSSSVMNSLGQGALGLYLGYRVVVVGDMSFGTLIALSMYMMQLLGAARGLAGLYQGVLNQLVPVDRMLDILEQERTIQEPQDAIVPGPLQGALALRDISFGYGDDKPVLQNINLEIAPGTFIAIVGPSGVGKTTILNLLLRLYDPDQGEVFIDGIPLRKLKLSSFREQVGIVLQETLLFNGTIRTNILYGNPEATEAEIRAAASLADAEEFISNLPNGYDTKIGEDGCLLSVGQRQRIGIARALVRHPRILLLDEATASLSSTSEAAILKALQQGEASYTLVVITHRLTAIHKADQIFVLHEGTIAERGTHEELLMQKGVYRILWDRQFGIDEEIADTQV